MEPTAGYELPTLRVGPRPCSCPESHDEPAFVVVTGGPGAGKTALLEIAAQSVCRHVAILPEAASIIFRGGFPRHDTLPGLKATQTAIFAVQRQLEAIVSGEGKVSVALCDRGTIDGVAYWPDNGSSFWTAMGADPDRELDHYRAVIHLRVPDVEEGYTNNAIRIESASRAAAIDRVIAAAWRRHSRRVSIPATSDFHAKVDAALEAIRESLPACCRRAVERSGADGGGGDVGRR